MKTKIVFFVTAFFITAFCSVFSPLLGIPFWKGLILSVLSGVFTMAVVTLIDIIAKLIQDGKQKSETV